MMRRTFILTSFVAPVVCLVSCGLAGSPAATAQEKGDSIDDRLGRVESEVQRLRNESKPPQEAPSRQRVPTWLPLWLPEVLTLTGALAFGAVVGWLTHHVFQRAKKPDVAWLGGLFAVIGGGAVTALFEPRDWLFNSYCAGLASAFFLRAAITRHQPSEAAASGP